MQEIPYVLRIDARESHENSKEWNIIKKLDKEKIPYEKTTLNIGDYELENTENGIKIIVERKIVPDFVSSVFDKRIFKELLQMEQNYSMGFLVVVGKWEDYYKNAAKLKRMKIIKNINSFSVAHRLGVFAHISCRYKNIKLIQVENDSQFLQLLPKLIEKCSDGKKLENEILINRKSIDNVYLNLLTSFPKIGLDKAKKIVEKYPSFQEFFRALKDNCFDVDGIGGVLLGNFKKELL